MLPYRTVNDFFFQAEDGIRDPLWSRGLGDVYKRQGFVFFVGTHVFFAPVHPLIVLVFSGLFAGCTYRLVQVESRKKVKSRNLAVFGR